MNWFDELKSQVLITFPNMPTNYVENAIQKSVRKFFRETHLLKDDAYIDAECGMNDYLIDVPDGRTIVQVKGVYSCSHPEQHPLLDSSWWAIHPAPHRFGSGYWVELSYSLPSLTLADCVSLAHGKYCINYSWCPNGKDCELPQHFIGKYADVLLAGALAELYLIPTDNDTQSAQMARFYLQEFRTAIKNAGAEESQNHTNRPLYMNGGCFL